MKKIKLFEEFEEFKKPNILQKVLKGSKRFLNLESKEDRGLIEKAYRMLDNRYINLITDIREIKPGVLICNFTTGSLVVDINDKSIIFNGKELELTDMNYECQILYDRLKNSKR